MTTPLILHTVGFKTPTERFIPSDLFDKLSIQSHSKLEDLSLREIYKSIWQFIIFLCCSDDDWKKVLEYLSFNRKSDGWRSDSIIVYEAASRLETKALELGVYCTSGLAYEDKLPLIIRDKYQAFEEAQTKQNLLKWQNEIQQKRGDVSLTQLTREYAQSLNALSCCLYRYDEENEIRLSAEYRSKLTPSLKILPPEKKALQEAHIKRLNDRLIQCEAPIYSPDGKLSAILQTCYPHYKRKDEDLFQHQLFANLGVQSFGQSIWQLEQVKAKAIPAKAEDTLFATRILNDSDYRHMLEDVIKHIKASWASLNIYQDNQYWISIVAGHENYPEVLPRTGGLSQRVMESQQALFITDTSTPDIGFHPNLQKSVKAAICVPIVIQSKSLGVVWFHFDDVQSVQYFEKLNSWLQMVINFIGYSLGLHPLHNDYAFRTAIEMARQSVGTKEAMPLRPVLQLTIERVKTVMSADSVVLFTYNHLDQHFDYPPIFSEGLLYPERYERQEGIARQSVIYDLLDWFREEEPETRKVYFVDNTAENAWFRASGFVPEEGIGACAVLPLRVSNHIVGIVFVNYPHSRSFESISWKTHSSELFTYLAAYSIYTTSLYRQNNSHVIASDAMHKSAEMMLTSNELQPILEVLVKATWELVNGGKDGDTCVGLYLLNKHSQEEQLSLLSYYPLQASSLAEHRIVLDMLAKENIYTRSFVEQNSRYVVYNDRQNPIYSLLNTCRSKTVVPIIASDDRKSLGLLVIEDSHAQALNKQTIGVIESLAKQAAIAIEWTEKQANEQRRIRFQEALTKASTTINQNLSHPKVNTIFQTLLSLVWDTMESKGTPPLSYLALNYHEPNNQDVLTFVGANPPEMLRHFRETNSEKIYLDGSSGPIGITGRTYLTGKLQNIPDVRVDKDYLEYDPNIKSVLCVPIISNDTVFGVIGMEHPDYAAFDSVHEDVLKSIAELTAITLTSAKNYQLNQSLEALKHLYNTIKMIANSGLSLRPTIDLIAEEALNIRTYYGHKPIFVTVALLNKKIKGELIIYSAKLDNGKDVVKDFERRLGRINIFDETQKIGMTGRAILTKQSQITSNIRTNDAASQDFIRYLDKTNSAIAVPIQYDDEVQGAINIEFAELNAFFDLDIELFTWMADFMAIEIRKSQAYEAIEKSKAILAGRTALAWMGMTSNIWRHNIESSALGARDRLWLLADRIERKKISVSVKDTPYLLEQLRELQSIVSAISDTPLTPLLASSSSEQVELIGLCRERAYKHWQNLEPSLYQEPCIKSSLKSAYIFASHDWIKQILDNLISNAFKAMEKCPVRSLSIEIIELDSDIEIRISDTGIGISTEVMNLLLNRPYEPSEQQQAGLGMGLLIVQAIVEAYQGSMDIYNNDVIGGTIVSVCLPKYQQLSTEE